MYFVSNPLVKFLLHIDCSSADPRNLDDDKIAAILDTEIPFLGIDNLIISVPGDYLKLVMQRNVGDLDHRAVYGVAHGANTLLGRVLAEVDPYERHITVSLRVDDTRTRVQVHSLLKKEILERDAARHLAARHHAGDWRCRRAERTACSSYLGHAAIDEDLAGRDEAAVVGGQEGDDIRDLLDGSRSGKGRYACRVFHEAVQRVTAGAGVFGSGCRDHPRADRVDPDAPAPQMRRPCPGEVADRRLSGTVDTPIGPAHRGDDRGVQDDRAARPHQRQGLLDGPDHTLHIYVQLILDVLLRQAAEWRLGDHAGICENDVDTSHFTADLAVEAVEIGRLGDVALDGLGTRSKKGGGGISWT